MKLFSFQNKAGTLSTERFELIYKTYYSRLFYYSFQFISDEDTAKDIVNDVFEKIWLQRKEIKEETISSFLYKLVQNRCIDYLRHKKAEQQYAELYELIAAETPEDNELYELRLLKIEKIISNLKEPTKGIFTLCYYHNKKYAEVAKAYNISSSAIKKHIMKVLKLLREEFEVKKTD